MRNNPSHARLLAAWVFVAILGADRLLVYVLTGLGLVADSAQVQSLFEGFLVGIVAAGVFLGMQVEWRSGAWQGNRIHAVSAFILLLVVTAFSGVLHPLFQGLGRDTSGLDVTFLNAVALSAIGALVSLVFVKVDLAVERVRLGGDDEAARAARNVVLQGVMALALVLTLGAFARDASQHLRASEAASAAELTSALVRLRSVVELSGRKAFVSEVSARDPGGFLRAFNMSLAQQANARAKLVAYGSRNASLIASIGKYPSMKTIDRAWEQVRQAGVAVLRAKPSGRRTSALVLVEAVDEFSPVIDRAVAAIGLVEQAREQAGSNLILDAVVGTLGIVMAASLLIPLLTVNASQVNRVGRALAQAQRLNENLAAYQRALDQHAICSVTDRSGVILEVNDQFVKHSGYSRDQIIGKSHRLLNSQQHSPAFFEAMWQTLSGKGFWRGEICNRRADGELFWVDACISPLLGENGQVDRFVAIAYDITERKQVEMRHQRRLRLERSLAKVRSEAMVQGAIYGSLPELLDVLNDVVGATSSLVVELGTNKDRSAWGLMLGYAKTDELAEEIEPGTLPRIANAASLGGLLLDALRQNELFGGLTARQLGASCFMAFPIGTGHDPMGVLLVAGPVDLDASKDELGLVAVAIGELLSVRRESDRRRDNEEHSRRLAKRDPLTGLGNRRDLMEQFEARSDHPEAKFAMLLVDLDRFKPINDTFGHAVGDTVLRIIADRLLSTVLGDYSVSRMGGDEFAILTEAHVSVDEEGALDLADRIIEVLSQPIKCDGHVLTVGASVGVALFPRDGGTFQEVLHCADAAMYRAKASRAGALVFNAVTDEGMRHRAELETELKLAMEDGSIIPFFQPFVDFGTGKVVGHEVLARWNHPVRGSVPTGEFVKIAEDAGLVDKLFWLMLRAACKLHVEGCHTTSLSLNLAPAQIENPMFIKQLIEELETLRFPPHLLEVEITETTAIGDLDRIRPMLMLLKGCGIQIALDDFGVGYSSLALLRTLPISKLKIDRSFTSDLETDDPGRAALINAILGIASAMFLKVTAEGIENEAVAEYLRANGAHYGQGYLYGRPSASIVTEVLPRCTLEPARISA